MYKSQQHLGPTVKCIVLSAALVLLLSSSSSHTAVHATDVGSSEVKFNERGASASVDNESSDNTNNLSNAAATTTQSTKTIFRVFQTLPYEPSSLSPSETMELTRKIRSTQAMIFAPSHKHYSNTNVNNNKNYGVGGSEGGGSITSSLQEDNIELALDIYTPSERREYLVKRGNHCHPSSSNSSGGSGALNALNDNYEDTSLQWYDVLSRYDSLMSGTANPSSQEDDPTTSSSKSNFKSNSNSAELERTAIELFKYCVLYNGDGHAYWGWDEQLLLPFRDVVSVDVNYGVVATTSIPPKFNMENVMDVQNVDVDTLDNTSEGSSSKTTSAAGSGGLSKSYIHESFLSISPYTPATAELSSMIRFLLETSDETLSLSPLLLSQELYRLIAASKDEGNVNSNTASEAAAAAAAADSGGNNDGSSGDGDKNNGATWTLLYNSCIPLADSESVIGNASTTSNTSPEFAFADVSSSTATTLLGGASTVDVHARRMAARCPRSQGGYCCLTFLPVSSNKSTGGVAGSEAGSKVAEGGTQMVPLMALHHPVGGWTSSHNGREVGDDDQKMMPYKLASTKSSTKSPLKLGGVPESDLPYVSKVRLVQDKTKEANLPVTTKALKFPTHPADTPNFFDILFENDCLPYRKECHHCLKDVNNEKPIPISQDADGNEIFELATENACSVCQLECPCYCDILCKVRPPPKPITRTYAVHPPAYRKEPNRLVPKIIHQTWFEPVTKDKYPNMSRLIESWKKSGWEYYFYDDETAGEFLGTHFPPEIREAYESITPGAFKADLFRYCVLLIRGGVYADMDVLLQTNLDDAVADDIGFMTPIDEPGIEVGHRSCLWNGLIASAPGHPFLARTIEIVVNNIRNRFTSVDYDDMLCPNPILSVSHTVDTLFTCGPCILGAGINNLLGRHMQTEFEIGDVQIWQRERTQATNVSNGNDVIRPDDQRLLIPGRTVIMEQDKNDMGAHRFTWADRHLIIAATDMPDYDDRPPSKEHYSKTHEKAGVYGMRKLYTDTKRANEEIRIVVEKFSM